MAKTESTAVNELIDLVQNRKAPTEPAADLFRAPSAPMHPPRMTSTIPAVRDIEPLPRQRAPQATSEHKLPPIPRPSVRMTTASPERGTTIPPLPPARAAAPAASPRTLPPPLRKSSPSGTLPPPVRTTRSTAHPPRILAARTSPPASAPIAAPFEPTPVMPQQFPIVQPPDAPADHWYEATPDAAKGEETWVGSATSKRSHAETLALVKKLIAPTIVLSIVGVMVGGYFAFDGQGGKKKKSASAKAPAVVADRDGGETEEVVLRPALPARESDNAATASASGPQPEPPTKTEQAAEIAAATMTREAPEAAVAAIAAKPAGSPAPAPAMREVQTPQGVIKFADVRIDSDPPGATVTLVDRGAQSFLGTTPLSTSVDASREYDVIIALDGRPTQMVHLDPRTMSRVDATLGRKVPRARSSRSSRESRDVSASAPAAVGIGTLMVSSKPPCDLYIDDKPTGLMTPQRSIELPAGTHTVTFVNEAQGIKKTVSVKITADQPTKLIQDLMTP